MAIGVPHAPPSEVEHPLVVVFPVPLGSWSSFRGPFHPPIGMDPEPMLHHEACTEPGV